VDKKYPPPLHLVVPEASRNTTSCVFRIKISLKKLSKSIRRAKFFEMISRLSLYAMTRGISLCPFRFYSTGLAINIAILKGDNLSFD